MQKKANNQNASLTPSSLPHNRKEQFKDIVKHRFMLLVLTAAMLFAGFFPAIGLYSWIAHISNVTVFSELISELGISQDMLAFSYFWILNVAYLVLIPLIMVGTLFLTGALRIYRLLAWDQGIFFFSDFFDGVKKNYKNGLLAGLILGLYIFITKFIGGALTMYVNGMFGLGVEIFLKAALVVFILPIIAIYLLFTTYFDDKFVNYLKNSFFVYVSKLFPFLLLSLFILIIYCIPLISNMYLIVIAIVLLMLFIVPFYLLTWNQIYLDRIDNMSNDTEVKLKGLFKPSNK